VLRVAANSMEALRSAAVIVLMGTIGLDSIGSPGKEGKEKEAGGVYEVHIGLWEPKQSWEKRVMWVSNVVKILGGGGEPELW